MSTYNSKHKQKERVVAQFMNFTQSNEKNAINFLTQHEWKLDLAVDAYYLSVDSGSRRDSSRSANSQVDRKKLDQIWNLYKGKDYCFFFKLFFSSVLNLQDIINVYRSECARQNDSGRRMQISSRPAFQTRR
jgi:hypothetical protein